MKDATKLSLFALLCAIWGSTWYVIKVGYGGLGPFNVASIRFLLAGALFVPVAWAMKARWPSTRGEWALVVWVAFALFFLDYGLIYWGEQSLDSGLTAILFAMMPLMTAILAHFYVPGDKLTLRKLGGVLLAFAGVVALFADHLRIDASKALPMLAIVGSTVAAAAASVATKRHGKDLHAAALNAPAMLLGGVLLALASFAVGDGYAVPTASGTWVAILYLAVIGSVVTFLIYFTLLKTWNVTAMSFIAVFTPVVALVLGFLALGERPSAWTALGAVLIIGGVALAVTKGSLRIVRRTSVKAPGQPRQPSDEKELG